MRAEQGREPERPITPVFEIRVYWRPPGYGCRYCMRCPMTEPTVGAQKKRDIAYVIASLLERERMYSHKDVERLIRDNVRPVVLEIPGLAADHIRLSMIECGFVERDARTNQIWVSPDFTRDHDHHALVSRQLELQAGNYPNQEFECPACNVRLRARLLFNHYNKKHAGRERWEEIVDAYFGWV